MPLEPLMPLEPFQESLVVLPVYYINNYRRQAPGLPPRPVQPARATSD